MYAGVYYDGEGATRWSVTVSVSEGSLRIRKEDGTELRWERGSFRQAAGTYGEEPTRFERGDEALVVTDPDLLLALGRPARRLGLVALGSALLLVFCVGGGYLYGLPALGRLAAARMPASWDSQLGEKVLKEIAPEGRRCADPEATEAVGEIVKRLLHAGPEAPPVTVTLTRDPLVNAFAVPGGRVVINAGLLASTRRPEELAGVLAHELQHVIQRHPTAALVRSLTLNALLSVIVGEMSAVLTTAATLGDLRYHREDETSADLMGMRMVLAARIDPQGTIDMFRTLEKTAIDLPGIMRYLSSHPLTEERIQRLGVLKDATPVRPEPLLPGRDWAKIARACGG